jgi:hypothetical protein
MDWPTVPLQLPWIVMIKDAALSAIIICSIALSAQGSNSTGITFTGDGKSEDLARVISWLPAKTETITVARGPFVLAAARGDKNWGQELR